MMTYNDIISNATRYISYFANFDHHMLKITDRDTIKNSAAKLEFEEIFTLQNHLRENLKFIARRMKKSSDKKRRDHDIQVEDNVFLNIKNIDFKKNSKLYHIKLESFKMKEQIFKVNFKLQLSKDTKIHSVFHVALLNKVDKSLHIMIK